MKRIIVLGLFMVLVSGLFAQVKLEAKSRIFRPFLGKIEPNVELISPNEKFGLEIGLGMLLNKATVIDPNEPILETTSLRYATRSLLSSASLYYYLPREMNGKFYAPFFGPSFTYQRATFYDDEFIARQDRIVTENPNKNPEFVGQREFGLGMSAGIKVILPSNLVFSMAIQQLVVFDEIRPDDFTRPSTQLDVVCKLGYRFGEKVSLKGEDD